MVNDARKYIYINQWAVVWPALAIASLVIGLNLFADGLREEQARFPEIEVFLMQAMPTPEHKTLPVLEVENLAIAYKIRGGEVEGVQNVTFTINQGETYGIVGESGCGKSTVAWGIVNFLGANGYIKRGTHQLPGPGTHRPHLQGNAQAARRPAYPWFSKTPCSPSIHP